MWCALCVCVWVSDAFKIIYCRNWTPERPKVPEKYKYNTNGM